MQACACRENGEIRSHLLLTNSLRSSSFCHPRDIGGDKRRDVYKQGGRMELVSHAYLDAIHRDALRVLEEVGIRCQSAEVRKIFEETGLAAYDESTGHLHILSPLVEQALTSVPGRENYWVPLNSFGVGGTAPFVYDDASGELIMPTFEHLVKIAGIVEACDTVAFMHRGVLIKNQEVKVMEALAAHCHKPLYISGVETAAGIAKAKDLHQERGRFTLQFAIMNSPLTVIESMLPAFLASVRQGIPVSLSTMPMAGLSAPYSLSGLVTLTHAESLFGIVLAQIINPGLTVVHAGLPSIANIQKNYSVDLGLLSHNVANLLLDKLNERLGLPSIHSGCTTSASQPGERAEQDAIMGYALMKKYGFHQMRHAFGFLKELVSFSIAKLERHAELCAQTGPEHAPEIVVDPFDPEGFETIKRNGSTPNFMKDDHTLKNTGRVFLA